MNWPKRRRNQPAKTISIQTDNRLCHNPADRFTQLQKLPFEAEKQVSERAEYATNRNF